MRREPTEEQRARAHERREKIRKLATVVSAMTDEQRLQMAQRHGIRTIEGHELSVFNHCLLLTQSDSVSVVGGFRQWKRAGRIVTKGQHGLAIWCPIKPKDKPDAGELNDSKTRFMLGTVFDVTQTQKLDDPPDDGADGFEEPETNGSEHANGATADSRQHFAQYNPQPTNVTEGAFQAL
jgi:hypothetical protein